MKRKNKTHKYKVYNKLIYNDFEFRFKELDELDRILKTKLRR